MDTGRGDRGQLSPDDHSNVSTSIETDATSGEYEDEPISATTTNEGAKGETGIRPVNPVVGRDADSLDSVVRHFHSAEIVHWN